MDIKLVCFDLDGTINDGWNLLPALKNKLISLKNKGVKLAIITGRETVGTLYFVYRAGFPFDFIGCGGGPIISSPLGKQEILELFEGHTVDIITKRGLSKTERFLKVVSMCGLTQEETLFIDDNNNKTLDPQEVSLKTKCMLATPLTNNQEWLSVINSRNGIISNKPCGVGTLEILNKVFID